MFTSKPIEKIVELFSTLPSIGKKTAQRLVFYILRQDKEFALSLANALIELHEHTLYCSTCFNFTDTDPCIVCSSQTRRSRLICVVEEPQDVTAVEKTREYKGMYHVLHGTLNPLEGIGPNEIKVRELLQRCTTDVEEVILALNASVEAELTIQYIAKLLKPLSITVTRLSRGLPVGTDLEYTDEATLARALEGRVNVQ
jgi:recombination protein RecR